MSSFFLLNACHLPTWASSFPGIVDRNGLTFFESNTATDSDKISFSIFFPFILVFPSRPERQPTVRVLVGFVNSVTARLRSWVSGKLAERAKSSVKSCPAYSLTRYRILFKRPVGEQVRNVERWRIMKSLGYHSHVSLIPPLNDGFFLSLLALDNVRMTSCIVQHE